MRRRKAPGPKNRCCKPGTFRKKRSYRIAMPATGTKGLPPSKPLGKAKISGGENRSLKQNLRPATETDGQSEHG